MAVPEEALGRCASALDTSDLDLWAMPAVVDSPHARRGATLKSARLRSGLTQHVVANHLGIAQSILSAYERGIGNPPARLVTDMLALTRPTVVAA